MTQPIMSLNNWPHEASGFWGRFFLLGDPIGTTQLLVFLIIWLEKKNVAQDRVPL